MNHKQPVARTKAGQHCIPSPISGGHFRPIPYRRRHSVLSGTSLLEGRGVDTHYERGVWGMVSNWQIEFHFARLTGNGDYTCILQSNRALS